MIAVNIDNYKAGKYMTQLTRVMQWDAKMQ